MMTIGPAMVMIESEWPTLTNRAPSPDGSSPVVLYVYVEDVDETVKRAVAAGAGPDSAEDQFWGDRTAWVMDPSVTFGPWRRAWKNLRKTNERHDSAPTVSRAGPKLRGFRKPLTALPSCADSDLSSEKRGVLRCPDFAKATHLC